MNTLNTSASFVKRGLTLLQTTLFIAAVYFLTRAAITLLTPESVWQMPDPAPMTTIGSTAVQAARLDTRFDPFHPKTSATDEIIEIGTDAPETTLNLKLFGRRAGKDGTAILETSDRTQKVFRIGDEIMNGVTLKAVHPGYIVLSQGGRIERLTFERENETLLATPEPEIAPTTETKTIFSILAIAAPKQMTAEILMAGINLAPSVANGRLQGFRISPKDGSVNLAALGLKSGDVVSAIGDIDLTSPTLNPAEIPAKISNRSQVRLTVLRAGQTVYVNLGQ